MHGMACTRLLEEGERLPQLIASHRRLHLAERAERVRRQLLSPRLDGKNCLIILDDVWQVEQPTPFKALTSSTVSVLLTTRKVQVANKFGNELPRLNLLPNAAALEAYEKVQMAKLTTVPQQTQ